MSWKQFKNMPESSEWVSPLLIFTTTWELLLVFIKSSQQLQTLTGDYTFSVRTGTELCCSV